MLLLCVGDDAIRQESERGRDEQEADGCHLRASHRRQSTVALGWAQMIGDRGTCIPWEYYTLTPLLPIDTEQTTTHLVQFLSNQ